MPARVMVFATIQTGQEEAFESAYRTVTAAVKGTPGRIRDELLRDRDRPGSYVLLSEWESAEMFLAWEDAPVHQELTTPMRPYWAGRVERTIFDVAAVLRQEIPANVRLERFIPLPSLLPHVDAMVTNGGYGGTQQALAHGIPLVVAGATEEKPETAARVAWAGVGVRIRRHPPSPPALRKAVRAVLDEPRYRRNAQRIQADMVAGDAAITSAALLERLAARGEPVLRADVTPSRSLSIA